MRQFLNTLVGLLILLGSISCGSNQVLTQQQPSPGKQSIGKIVLQLKEELETVGFTITVLNEAEGQLQVEKTSNDLIGRELSRVTLMFYVEEQNGQVVIRVDELTPMLSDVKAEVFQAVSKVGSLIDSNLQIAWRDVYPR